MFQRVYGVRSSSNNNLWLRKKLIEAVNTRPRGGSGERAPRAVPAGAGTAAAAAARAASLPSPAEAGAGGDGLVRRRKKKGAPVRASDGLQVGAAHTILLDARLGAGGG